MITVILYVKAKILNYIEIYQNVALYLMSRMS